MSSRSPQRLELQFTQFQVGQFVLQLLDLPRVLLELTDISFKLVPSSGFAVFLDCAGRAAKTDPVGLIDIFGATHHGMETMAGMNHLKATQRFGKRQRLWFLAVNHEDAAQRTCDLLGPGA